jgi:hypothetical protein
MANYFEYSDSDWERGKAERTGIRFGTADAGALGRIVTLPFGYLAKSLRSRPAQLEGLRRDGIERFCRKPSAQL